MTFRVIPIADVGTAGLWAQAGAANALRRRMAIALTVSVIVTWERYVITLLYSTKGSNAKRTAQSPDGASGNDRREVRTVGAGQAAATTAAGSRG